MRTYILLGILLCGAASNALAQAPIRGLLDKVPSNDGYDFRCENMIQAVNALRSAGKEKALETLRSYIKEPLPYGADNVLLICRVLFVNTNEWKNFALGVPLPKVSTNAEVLFPLFPIAISEGVPFELVAGYSGVGANGNPPDACVKICEGLTMIPADLKQTNYEAAARALIQSKPFEQLYRDAADRRKATEMILMQAGVKKKINEYFHDTSEVKGDQN